MNYLAHGRDHLDDPYVLAGTAAPDWLNVIDRKMKLRSRRAKEFVADDDPVLSAFARGVVRHHADDDWFHRTAAFAELSLAFTVRIRDQLPADEGFRPSFLGHIIVELLLDAALMEARPALVDDYYRTLCAVEPTTIERVMNHLATRTTDRVVVFLPRFLSDRFLYDYREDGKLATRLNHVLRRVGLPPLPDDFAPLLAQFRGEVRERQTQLLTPPRVAVVSDL